MEECPYGINCVQQEIQDINPLDKRKKVNVAVLFYEKTIYIM